MVARNPLRSRYGTIYGASLIACGAFMGCSVYDDELLRQPLDASRSERDATVASDDAAKRDGAPPSDARSRDETDARTVDGTSMDTGSSGDAGATTDAPTRDDVVVDASAPRPDVDAAARDVTFVDARVSDDAYDAPIDSATGSSDADAGGRAPDANDATSEDASRGADAATGDGEGGPLDVAADGDGGIAPPTFRVVRVGNGSTTLSASSTASFIEERRLDGQLVGQPIALPTSRSGAMHPLTLSGIATSEGALALSIDGRYLTLAGYAAGPDRANIATSTDVERVVARVDAAANIDTTTVLGDAFSGTNARSAVSVDGTAFWVGGASGGVWFAPLGGSGPLQIIDDPNNVRLVGLFGDQLFGCSGTSPMTTVFTIGAGRPTIGIQSVVPLAGMPRSGSSPYAFALLDRDPSVSGLDTLYLTDDRSPESDGTGGGIQKWTLQGTTWSRGATLTTVDGGSASFRGLAATVTAAGVMLVASTAETSANRLVVFVDDGSPSPVGTAVVAAPSNTIFRGVALSPHP